MIQYKEQLSPVQELLILTVKDRRTEAEIMRIRTLYRQVGDGVLFQAAKDNKVMQIVAHGLIEAFSEEDIPSKWVQSHRQTAVKVESFFEELDRLSLLLSGYGISMVLIENGGIARDIYTCSGCFASSDVEILVDKQDLSMIERILEKEGYRSGSRARCASEKPEECRGWNNYWKQITEDIVFWLNVQWQPVLRRWLPMEKKLSASELISRSIPVKDKGSKVRILSAEDNLLLCALHIASHSYVRGIGLRLQLDIDHLVHRVTINWDLFLRRAHQYQAAALVFASLAVPKGLLGTPVPDFVIDRLLPHVYKRKLILRIIAKASVFKYKAYKFNPLQLVILEILLSDKGLIDGLRRVFFPEYAWIKEVYRELNKPVPFCFYLERLLKLARKPHA